MSKNSATQKCRKPKKLTNKWLPADYVFVVILALLALSVIIPFMNVISISLSSDVAYNENRAMIFPKDITFVGYKALLGGIGFWRSFAMTVFYVVVFVTLRLVSSLIGGYAIAKKGVGGTKVMVILLMIPMLFSGGAVPTYLLMVNLGFVDNIMVFLIVGCLDCYHILLVKTFLRGIPDSMEEAATLDGANVIQVLFMVLAPMCKPVLVTIGMLAAIDKWNNWYLGDMYIQDITYLLPLQNLVMTIQESSMSSITSMDIFGDINIAGYQKAFERATTMVVTLPMMMVYPFIQKYFEKGLNLGSVKE